MKTVSVSDLKAHLSQYLRIVERGSEVQILDRGMPIARLVAVTRGPGRDDARLDRLVAAGIVRKGTGAMREFLAAGPVATTDVDLPGALAEDREDRL
ncbi:MAG TPA: type II toxin-antitoxin system prevent-host-death family antitoxin [Polyangia bacterium]|nr:type II toxin-antitoxin system prevent-host-death family antitoxin [Polyangia bacterium]